MKVIIHIGWHKTGSTAIQQYLYDYRQQLLNRFGVLYPETGRLTVAHHLVAWSLQEPLINPWARSIGFHEKAEDLFSAIFYEAMVAGARSILISSEEFVTISPDRLVQLLKGHEVQVIVYLRRQDCAVESFYSQVISQFDSKLTMEFKEYVASLGNWLYTTVLNRWEHGIPGVIMTPRVYERSRFLQGNVVADFLDTIGLDMPEVFTEKKNDINDSLNSLSIRALVKINATYQLDREVHQKVLDLLRMVDISDKACIGFFSAKERVAYLSQFEASNQELFRRWFNCSNNFIIPPDELAGYVAQDAAMDLQTIEQGVQARLRKVTKYLEKFFPIRRQNRRTTQDTDQSTSSVKPTTYDRADELRDVAMTDIARGDWQKALNNLFEAHRLRPTGPFIRLNLARTLIELGRADEAYPHLEAIAAGTDFPDREPLLSQLQARVKVASYRMTSYDGFCPICEKKTIFSADNHWFRDSLKCKSCNSVPRERALALVILSNYPNWRDLNIHEYAPVTRGFSARLKAECKGYTPTHFFPDKPLGNIVHGYRNENIESQTFTDEVFDLVVSLDIMEHLFNPDKAYSEIWRTLKPNGLYIHTFPIHKNQVDAVKDRAIMKQDGSVEHLVEKPEYHGNPIDVRGSLVTRDYGYDISKLIAEWSSFDVQITRYWDRTLGIIGEYTEVIVCKKRKLSSMECSNSLLRNFPKNS